MIFAVDAQAVGQLLRAGRLACPGCGGWLRVWTSARTRRIDAGHGQVIEVTPDRGRCRSCGTTHVVLPAWYVPRRAYTVEVIGRVLLAGAQTVARHHIADRLGLAAGTVASWLTAARKATGPLIRHAHTVAAYAIRQQRSPAHWLGSDLAEALDAIGSAAQGFAQAALDPPTRALPGGTGIDYLQLVARARHRDLSRQLHLADPDALTTATPWQIVNLLTARHGFLTAPAG
jgi:Domain of unknown function (DUF6431)